VTPLEGPPAEAAAAARRGELIVVPTDTVYGLGSRPDDHAATGRIFEAKRRPRQLELPVLVADRAMGRTVAVFDERAERLVASCWPGPLTLVLPRGADAVGWELGGDPATVGVRAPAHPLALAVLMETGPLAVTSANVSGEPTPATCDELHGVFGDLVSVYLCDPEPLEASPSTVLDLAHGPAHVLREGSVTLETLAELLPNEPSLLDSRPSS
jgi:tRNA threonylcarbamoyl adenosine modification protein (Sua5/YciO/YrdC/YwlC family)